LGKLIPYIKYSSHALTICILSNVIFGPYSGIAIIAINGNLWVNIDCEQIQ
jgi:hypothetical protein